MLVPASLSVLSFKALFPISNLGLSRFLIASELPQANCFSDQSPLSIDAGVSQLVENVPIRWHLTLENLQQWNIAFSNPNRGTSSLDGETTQEKVSFFNNALRHVIIGAELFPEKGFNIRLGYNFRRGQELSIVDQRNFSGISAGFGLRFGRIRFNYSYSKYTVAANTSMFGLMVNLD